MNLLVCCGLGYSAQELALRLRPKGWMVRATSRSESGVARITELGFEGYRFHDAVGAPDVLDGATHLLVSAPPEAAGDPLLRVHSGHLAAAADLGWIGYLSTVGVYGDHDGAWVDEDAALNAVSPRAVARVAAEAAWLEFGYRTGKRVEVFRLAGIYGPGRSAIDNLRAGTAWRIIKAGQVFNRIHVADIAGVLAAAIARPTGHRIYNVADDEPAPPQDVIAYAAHLIGVPVPPDQPYETAELSPMARSFYADCRRVSNRRVREALGYRFQHPTYREGLAAIAAGPQ